jgi:hypothetical protein
VGHIVCPFHLLEKTVAISSKARCLLVSKTELYGLSRICFEMTRQVEGVSVKLADEQHNRERTDSTKAISQKSNLYIDSQGGRGGGTPPVVLLCDHMYGQFI